MSQNNKEYNAFLQDLSFLRKEIIEISSQDNSNNNNNSNLRGSNDNLMQNVTALKEKQALLKLKLAELEKEQLFPPTDMNNIDRGAANASLRVSTAQIKMLKRNNDPANNAEKKKMVSSSTEGKFSSTVDNFQQNGNEFENTDDFMDSQLSNSRNDDETKDDSIRFQRRSNNNNNNNNNSSLLSDESNTDITNNSSLYEDSTSINLDETTDGDDNNDDGDDDGNGINNKFKFNMMNNKSERGNNSKANVSLRNHRMLLNSRIISNPEPRPHQQLLHSNIPLSGHRTKRAPVKLLHFNRDITVDGILKKSRQRKIPVDVNTNETQTSGEHFKSKTQEIGTTVDLIPPKPATLEIECQTDLPDDLSEMQRQMLSKADENKDEEEEPVVPIKSGPVMMPPSLLLNIDNGGNNNNNNNNNKMNNNKILNNQNDIKMIPTSSSDNTMSSYYDRHFLDVVDLELINLPKSIIKQFQPSPSEPLRSSSSSKKNQRRTTRVRKNPIPSRFEDLLPSKVDEEYTKLTSKGKYAHARIYQIEQAADMLGREFDQSDDALKRLENMLDNEEGVSTRRRDMVTNDSTTSLLTSDNDYNNNNHKKKNDVDEEDIIKLDKEVEEEMKDAWDLLKELEAHIGGGGGNDGKATVEEEDNNAKP